MPWLRSQDWVRALAGAVLAGSALACARTDVLEGGVLRKGELRVELGPIPEGWRRVDVEGADLAFRDDAREGSALLDIRCGLRGEDAPLGILTENLVMGTTERAFESQNIVPFDRREAMHTVLRAKLDGVPMQYDIYVMKKDGCVYDVVYVAPPALFRAGAPAFERFVSAVHSLPSRSSAAEGERRAPRDP